MYACFFFIHSSVDGYLGFLGMLAIVNNAPRTLKCMHFFQISVFIFFRYIRRRLAGSYGGSMFSFMLSLPSRGGVKINVFCLLKVW